MANILSIEDDPILQELTGMVLSDHGHTVHSAFTGEEGYEKAQSLKPDLILLDMMLPTINGLEVLRLLKSTESVRRIPVFVMTAHSGENAFREDTVKSLGAREFLQKPLKLETLVGMIDATLKARPQD
jgi:CheY-like chemotaxis protein